MGDFKRLGHLEKPEWLKVLIAAFPDKPTVIQFHTQVWQDQVNREARTAIAAKAMEQRGSKKWILMTGRPFEGPEGTDAYLPGNNKCNLFVYEMLSAAGVHVPLREYDSWGPNRLAPPLAGEWANPKKDIPGFQVLTVPPDVPQPGDVAAIAKVSWDATGHVGIVANAPDGKPNWTVSGRHDGVVHNDWGFRDENKGQVVFRRFVGPLK